MSKFVTFNGQTRYTPGGITKVTVSNLGQVPGSTNGTIYLIGEAEDGAPGTEEVVVLADPSNAKTIFRAGPLADAANPAFSASGDPDVPGGGSLVYFYKTNASTQATAYLPSEPATVAVTSTATGGSTATIIDTTLSATTVDDQFNGMWAVLRPYTSTAEVRRITDYVASTGVITVSPVLTLAASAANAFVIVHDELAEIDALVAGTSSSTLLTAKSHVFVASEHVDRWVYIQNTSTQSFLRKITANTTGALTISPPLPATPTAGAWFQILPNSLKLTSVGWGAHTNGLSVASVSAGVTNTAAKIISLAFEGKTETSPEIGGAIYLKVLYKGGAAFTDAATSTSTAGVVAVSGGGYTIDAHIGKQLIVTQGSYTEYTTIVSNTALTFTVSPALSFTPTTADVVQISSVTSGTVKVTGASGAATGLSTTVAGVTGDNLTVPFTAGMSLRSLASAVQAASANYVVTIPGGINADTSLAANLDFGPGTSTTVLNSAVIATTGLRQDVASIVNYFNTKSQLATAERSDVGTYDGLFKPYNQTSAIQFSGGTRGISTNSSFQAGMDAALLVRANSTVPLIDQDLTNEGYGSTATVASVAAQLGAHVALARGTGQSERGGFIGFQGTKSEILTQLAAINDFDVQMVAENVVALNSAGSLQTFGPFMQAVIAASMRAGVTEVAEPLTHKFLRVNGITTDGSWDPADKTDAQDMIIAGLLFAEKVEGSGVRWVRDITTCTSEESLAYTEGSVRDAVRFYAYGLRTFLVNRFTGKKGLPVTVAGVKDAVRDFSEVQRTNNVITDSADPATGELIYAYHNIKVTMSGDVITVRVGFFPVPGVNFILNDLYVQIPSQSA